MPLINIDKFTGGLHSPEVTSDIQLDPTDCTDVQNVEYYPRGTISKREGYISYDMSSTPITGVMKIFPWKDTNFLNSNLIYTTTSGANVSADVYVMSLSGDTISLTRVFSGESYASTQWSPTLSANEIHVASYGGSAVSVYGGSGPPLVYATSPGCAVPWAGAPSGAKFTAAWGQYLFLGNLLVSSTRKRSRIQWNSLGDLSNWPSSYWIDVDPDDGDEITGLKLLGDYLVVFKRNKIFVVYWQGGALLFKELRRSSTVGCIAGRTIVEKDQKLYFLADDGFYSFDGTNTVELSKKIKYQVYQINQAYNWLHHAEIYEPHRQIWFAVSVDSGGMEALESYQKYANKIFVYDWELTSWTVYDIPSTAFGTVLLGTDYYWYDLSENYAAITKAIGSYTGTESALFLIGHANYTNATKKSCLSRFGGTSSDITSTAINAYWQSIWFDLGDPTVNKRYTRWTMMADQESTTNAVALTAQLHENFKSATYLLEDGTASTFSNYLTGSNSYQTGSPMEIRMDTSRTCRAFQIKLWNNIANHKFTVHKLIVDGMVKGRTLVS